MAGKFHDICLADALRRRTSAAGAGTGAAARRWAVFAGGVARAAGHPAGFTLVELLMTFTIILLVIGIAVPSAVELFSSGAESQAYNVLAAQLIAARALAIRSATYAGVHVQIAALNTGQAEGKCYVAVVWDDPSPATPGHEFTLAEDFLPRQLPGGLAFGEISSTYVNPASGVYSNTLSSAAGMEGFTTFTIVFSPTGAVVRSVQGGDVTFDGNDAVFSGRPNIKLWEPPSPEQGVAAVVLFNYQEAVASSNAQQYLTAHAGAYIAVNMCTGQLFPRE